MKRITRRELFERVAKQVDVIVEALPYIKKFYGQTLVIKYGGSAMRQKKLREKVIQDLVILKYVGMNPVVVHGGGKLVSRAMRKKGIEPEFVDGMRVTSSVVIDIVRDVLVNRVAKNIVALIKKNEGNAISLSKKNKNLIGAAKLFMKKGGRQIDLGFTGRVTRIDTAAIEATSAKGFIPIISSIGLGKDGNFYNINADVVASAIAEKMEACKLILLTDVDGVLAKDKKLISKLRAKDVRRLIRNGTISGGMIPKVRWGLDALKGGVEKVHIINGKISHSLILEIFTNLGIGTMIEV